MPLWLALAALLALATAAHPEDLRKEKLFSYLAAATSQKQGQAMESEIWKYWLDQAPTLQVRGFVDKGMERREAYDFRAAEENFDEAVKAAPEYAEGWNQRAFARFLRDNNEGALADLEKALELEPRHFGAWSGMYHVLFRMGRMKAAHAALAQAVKIHPWLKERDSLPPDLKAAQPPSNDL